MVIIDESIVKNYNLSKRYFHILPSLAQKKNRIVSIYEDREVKKVPNSTYRYIVIYQDKDGLLYQDFVDTDKEGIQSFINEDL